MIHTDKRLQRENIASQKNKAYPNPETSQGPSCLEGTGETRNKVVGGK